jgi:hypothetical protein
MKNGPSYFFQFSLDDVTFTKFYNAYGDGTTSYVAKETRQFIPLFKSLYPFPHKQKNSEIQCDPDKEYVLALDSQKLGQTYA